MLSTKTERKNHNALNCGLPLSQGLLARLVTNRQLLHRIFKNLRVWPLVTDHVDVRNCSALPSRNLFDSDRVEDFAIGPSSHVLLHI